MGGKLIYQFPEKMTFRIDEETKEQRINEFIDVVERAYGNTELANFLEGTRDGFYDNRVPEDWDDKIKKGCKLVKAFKHFVPNEPVLKDLQNRASHIIQEESIEGYVRFSVHPLDFLSLSENNHKWRSCHTLDGDYRAGNLSYMVDKSTFICYVCDEKYHPLPHFPFEWNSKKWRALMFMSEDWNMMFAGRQYPFASQPLLDFIKDPMMETSGLTLGSSWFSWDNKTVRSVVSGMTERNYHFVADYYPVGHELIKAFDLIQEPKYALHFNDLLYSNSYTPLYTFRKRNPHAYFISNFGNTSNRTRFKIGGDVTCLCCGEHKIKESDMMWCINCEEDYGNSVNESFGYCSCCGAHVHEKHSVIAQNGDILCHHCAESETRTCACCESVYYIENINYDEKLGQYICGLCAESMNDNKGDL